MRGDAGRPTAYLFFRPVVMSIASTPREDISGSAPAFLPRPPRRTGRGRQAINRSEQFCSDVRPVSAPEFLREADGELPISGDNESELTGIPHAQLPDDVHFGGFSGDADAAGSVGRVSRSQRAAALPWNCQSRSRSAAGRRAVRVGQGMHGCRAR